MGPMEGGVGRSRLRRLDFLDAAASEHVRGLAAEEVAQHPSRGPIRGWCTYHGPLVGVEPATLFYLRGIEAAPFAISSVPKLFTSFSTSSVIQCCFMVLLELST